MIQIDGIRTDEQSEGKMKQNDGSNTDGQKKEKAK